MDNIIRNLALTTKVIERTLSNHFAANLNINLSTEAMGILWLVNYRPDLIQQEIAETLKKDKSAVLRLIDTLEKKGLLQRNVAATDRRRNIINITDKGKALVSNIDNRINELSLQLFNGLNPTDIEIFCKVLNHLSNKATEI